MLSSVHYTMTFSCRLIPKECIHRVQFGINYKQFGTKCWNSGLSYYSGIEQLGNLPALCKNIAGGWTQNAISILFAKYRLVSEVLGIWFLRRASCNFVHNVLLISVKDWYSCQLLIFSSDDIVFWSKFPNFNMQVGCQKLSAMLNLCLIEYWKI